MEDYGRNEFLILKEDGYEESLFGLGLNKKITSSYDSLDDVPKDVFVRLEKVANELSGLDGGHNKFLESINVWMSLTLSQACWNQFDTYRCGISKQSESKMHTIMKQSIKNEDFLEDVPQSYLNFLNELREKKEFNKLISLLPMGYLQRRIICVNYRTLRNIYQQRKNHKLVEWKRFCDFLGVCLKHFSYIK